MPWEAGIQSTGRSRKPAVVEAHIDLGASWCGCGLTEVRVD